MPLVVVQVNICFPCWSSHLNHACSCPVDPQRTPIGCEITAASQGKIQRVVVEIFLSKSTNIKLFVAPEGKSGDHQSHQGSSSGEDEHLYSITRRSILSMLRYFIVDQSGRQHEDKHNHTPLAAVQSCKPRTVICCTWFKINHFKSEDKRTGRRDRRREGRQRNEGKMR